MDDNKDTNVVDNGVVEPTNAGQQEPVKTYTKEDIDNSFNAGVKKASSEWQKDEKYKEFLEWKKTNQSDSEKIANLELDKTNLSNQVKSLEAQIKVANSNVKKEFSKFVTSEVLNLVNDTTDFETALKNFKKDNPQYFGEVVVKKVQSSPNLNGGGSQGQTTNSIMNDILRNARNN